MADAATDAAIAIRFPREWARANNPALPNRSKARQQLRQRYAFALRAEAWRASHPDAFCANCAHRSHPVHRPTESRCDLDSDFHGDSMIKHPEEHWCVKWSAA